MNMQTSQRRKQNAIRAKQSGKQLLVLLIAFFCFILGMFLTPDNAQAMGVMALSLNSDIELVRHTTLIEIQFIRVMLILLSILLIILGVWWKHIMQSSFIVELSSSNQQRVYISGHTRTSLTLLLLSILLALAYLIMDSYILEPSVASFISREDGFIEQLTALLFLICSFQAALLFFRTESLNRKVFPTIFVIGFFLCFGEEISWGQRIFGWETSEAMRSINVQAETNIHNISGYFADHLFIAGTFLYGGVLPFIAKNSSVIRNFCFRIGLPVASLYLATVFCIASLIHEWTIYRVIQTGTLRAAELRELLSAFCFTVLMWESLLCSKKIRQK